MSHAKKTKKKSAKKCKCKRDTNVCIRCRVHWQSYPFIPFKSNCFTVLCRFLTSLHFTVPTVNYRPQLLYYVCVFFFCIAVSSLRLSFFCLLLFWQAIFVQYLTLMYVKRLRNALHNITVKWRHFYELVHRSFHSFCMHHKKDYCMQ